MFGWMRRRSKSSETDNDDGEQLLDSLERQLAAVNQECDAQANASSILKAFAEVLAKSSGRILDARQLPFPKNVVREAFARRIRFLERCSAEDPGNPALEEDLGLHRSLLLRVSDFQKIDPEDETVVIEANAGRLSDRKTLLLFLKYHQRGMKEDGLPVNDPLERENERIRFVELCRKKGIS